MKVACLSFSQHARNFEWCYTLENAQENIVHLIADAGLDMSGVTVCFQEYNDGYYNFRLHRWLRVCNVFMPGFPVECVRFTGQDDQDIWRFPRLYVDGCSWVWKFAVGIVKERLIGEGNASK